MQYYVFEASYNLQAKVAPIMVLVHPVMIFVKVLLPLCYNTSVFTQVPLFSGCE